MNLPEVKKEQKQQQLSRRLFFTYHVILSCKILYKGVHIRVSMLGI